LEVIASLDRVDSGIAMKLISIILCSLALAGCGSASAQRGCGGYGGLSEEVCLVSHLRLIANPEQYDGKLVKFISVLEDLDGNHFRLYYSTEAMRIQTPQDAIVLEGDIKDFINRAKVKNGDWVSIVGRFTQMTGNEIQGIYLGAVRGVVSIAPGH